jgi:hypothetical protein
VAVKPESGNANGESDDDGDEDDDEENQDEDGVDMDGEEDAEEEDSVLLSETQRSLPDFKDPVEEASYIGYRIDGRLKAGDFGEFKPPKAFAVVQVRVLLFPFHGCRKKVMLSFYHGYMLFRYDADNVLQVTRLNESSRRAAIQKNLAENISLRLPSYRVSLEEDTVLDDLWQTIC